MLRRGAILLARGKGCSLSSSDRFLAKLSLNDSHAKPKRNRRDRENSTTALSDADEFLNEARTKGKFSLEDELIYQALLNKRSNTNDKKVGEDGNPSR